MSNNFIRLSTGAKMPLIGLGTLAAKGDELKNAVKTAIDIGYRHIDTAYAYFNEKEIGEALQEAFKAGKVKRSEMFITTKLHIQYLHKEDVLPILEQQLKDLQLDYVDLYLVHASCGVKKSADGNPFPIEYGHIAYDVVDHMETWSAMEEAYKAGLAKHIGVANYSVKSLQKLYDEAAVKPHNLQCELHAYWPQNELRQLCNRLSIGLTSYGSMGSPGARIETFKVDKPIPILMRDPAVVRIAEKYKKTPAQVLLRWVTQQDICAIPKSTNATRLKENFDVFDFKLADKDFDVLSNLSTRQRLYNTTLFQNHPQRPADDDPY